MTGFSGNFAFMDLIKILARTEARIAELGTTAAEVSAKATRSKDTIRNWQRRAAQGGAGASTKSITAVAEALGVPLPWLMGQGPDKLADYLGQDGLRSELLARFDLLDEATQRVAVRQIAALVPSLDEVQPVTESAAKKPPTE